MVGAYSVSMLRGFRANFLRVLTIAGIMGIGICIVTAVSGLPSQIRQTLQSFDPDPMQKVLAEAVADKVEILAFIFPLFFVAVSALTASTTITRLIEESRASTACFKTLGYSTFAVVLRYAIFAVVCAILGGTLGIVSGEYLLAPVLYDAIKIKFDLPLSVGGFYGENGIVWGLMMASVVLAVAIGVACRAAMPKPAVLLRPKSPKAGKKIFLERIGFLWKPLKFKYKSTLRNIMRYKSRLIMTVLSVAGSTALVFCGLGLYTSLYTLKDDPVENAGGLVESIVPISAAIVICSVLLAVLVLFNLTYINIEERKREVATLKVLGYTQLEIVGFIYREVFILSLLGIAVGAPSGYCFLGFLFDYIEFGSLEHIKWHTWLLTAAASLLAVALTDVLLYRKIEKIEMCGSLKTVE